jgi:hypothetical protein
MADMVTDKLEDSKSSHKPRTDDGEEDEDVFTPESLSAEADKHGFHEHRAGRLVIDPNEARAEYGEIADRLKLSKDGRFVLWPQPTNRPEDPQNVGANEPRSGKVRRHELGTDSVAPQWPEYKKNYMLAIMAAAAIVPDFGSGLGIASLFQLAE